MAILVLLFSCDFTTSGGNGGNGGSGGGGGGTGGSGNLSGPATASGRVIDQADSPMVNFEVRIGSKTALTDSEGKFSFTELNGDIVDLRGHGGPGGLYLLEKRGVSIQAGKANDLGDITVYKINGVGVIEPPSSPAPASRSRAAFLAPLAMEEQLELDILRAGTPSREVEPLTRAAVRGRAAPAVESSYLTDNKSYFQLSWEPLTKPLAAVRYEIIYAGKDGSGTTDIVWKSDSPNSKFKAAAPLVNLLITSTSLDGKISGPGEYYFKIRAYDSSNNMFELPLVKCSLGMILAGYTAASSYDSPAKKLTWTAVSGVTSYRVIINGKRSAELTAPELTIDPALFGGLIEGNYYECRIVSYANDGKGRKIEITVAKWGFNF